MKWEEARVIVRNLQDEHIARTSQQIVKISSEIKGAKEALRKLESELLELEKDRRQWEYMKHELLLLRDPLGLRVKKDGKKEIPGTSPRSKDK